MGAMASDGETGVVVDALGTYRGMFDQHDDMGSLNADWWERRGRIPKWAEDGHARGRLAVEHANRADVIRGIRGAGS